MINSVQKNVSLPAKLAQDLQLKASRIGLSVSEYLRILIFNATEDLRQNQSQLSKQAEKTVTASFKDYEEGDYLTLDSEKKMDQFLQGELNE
jgi:hypothetical protein